MHCNWVFCHFWWTICCITKPWFDKSFHHWFKSHLQQCDEYETNFFQFSFAGLA